MRVLRILPTAVETDRHAARIRMCVATWQVFQMLDAFCFVLQPPIAGSVLETWSTSSL